MVYVVLHLPEIDIASESIKRITRHGIQPSMFGKTLVATFVHDVKPKHSQIDT